MAMHPTFPSTFHHIIVMMTDKCNYLWLKETHKSKLSTENVDCYEQKNRLKYFIRPLHQKEEVDKRTPEGNRNEVST